MNGETLMSSFRIIASSWRSPSAVAGGLQVSIHCPMMPTFRRWTWKRFRPRDQRKSIACRSVALSTAPVFAERSIQISSATSSPLVAVRLDVGDRRQQPMERIGSVVRYDYQTKVNYFRVDARHEWLTVSWDIRNWLFVLRFIIDRQSDVI